MISSEHVVALLQLPGDSTAAALAVPPGTMGRRFLLTAALIAGAIVVSAILRAIVRRILRSRDRDHPRFWTEQFVSLATLVIIVVGFLMIWFDDPRRLISVLGLVAAGLAVALQRVITAFAAYLIILRGDIFKIGDRIVIGGVRGDVIGLGFMQTTVMEMGQSAPESPAKPAVWVGGRQYTGRIVRVTNDKIFDEPLYNYTREFPFVWEELKIPIHYNGQRALAERILLEVAKKHTDQIAAEAQPALDKLEKAHFFPGGLGLEPNVYYTLTDNWIEMALRFISREPGVRKLKDAMSRDIVDAFEKNKITIASTNTEISITSPVRLEGGNVR